MLFNITQICRFEQVAIPTKDSGSPRIKQHYAMMLHTMIDVTL